MTEVLDYKIRVSNACAFTPEGTTMFFTDSPTRRIFVFDYDAHSGLTNRRLLYELPSSVPGFPDGAQCDCAGCLWVAISGASRVIRLTREGRVDMVVEVPVKSPTSVTFGGVDLNTLFITTRGPDGGQLFAVKMPHDIVGVPEVPFADYKPIPNHIMCNKNAVAPESNTHFCKQCGMEFSSLQSRFCSMCGVARAC